MEVSPAGSEVKIKTDDLDTEISYVPLGKVESSARQEDSNVCSPTLANKTDSGERVRDNDCADQSRTILVSPASEPEISENVAMQHEKEKYLMLQHLRSNISFSDAEADRDKVLEEFTDVSVSDSEGSECRTDHSNNSSSGILSNNIDSKYSGYTKTQNNGDTKTNNRSWNTPVHGTGNDTKIASKGIKIRDSNGESNSHMNGTELLISAESDINENKMSETSILIATSSNIHGNPVCETPPLDCLRSIEGQDITERSSNNAKNLINSVSTELNMPSFEDTSSNRGTVIESITEVNCVSSHSSTEEQPLSSETFLKIDKPEIATLSLQHISETEYSPDEKCITSYASDTVDAKPEVSGKTYLVREDTFKSDADTGKYDSITTEVVKEYCVIQKPNFEYKYSSNTFSNTNKLKEGISERSLSKDVLSKSDFVEDSSRSSLRNKMNTTTSSLSEDSHNELLQTAEQRKGNAVTEIEQNDNGIDNVPNNDEGEWQVRHEVTYDRCAKQAGTDTEVLNSRNVLLAMSRDDAVHENSEKSLNASNAVVSDRLRRGGDGVSGIHASCSKDQSKDDISRSKETSTNEYFTEVTEASELRNDGNDLNGPKAKQCLSYLDTMEHDNHHVKYSDCSLESNITEIENGCSHLTDMSHSADYRPEAIMSAVDEVKKVIVDNPTRSGDTVVQNSSGDSSECTLTSFNNRSVLETGIERSQNRKIKSVTLVPGSEDLVAELVDLDQNKAADASTIPSNITSVCRAGQRIPLFKHRGSDNIKAKPNLAAGRLLKGPVVKMIAGDAKKFSLQGQGTRLYKPRLVTRTSKVLPGHLTLPQTGNSKKLFRHRKLTKPIAKRSRAVKSILNEAGSSKLKIPPQIPASFDQSLLLQAGNSSLQKFNMVSNIPKIVKEASVAAQQELQADRVGPKIRISDKDVMKLNYLIQEKDKQMSDTDGRVSDCMTIEMKPFVDKKHLNDEQSVALQTTKIKPPDSPFAVAEAFNLHGGTSERITKTDTRNDVSSQKTAKASENAAECRPKEDKDNVSVEMVFKLIKARQKIALLQQKANLERLHPLKEKPCCASERKSKQSGSVLKESELFISSTPKNVRVTGQPTNVFIINLNNSVGQTTDVECTTKVTEDSNNTVNSCVHRTMSDGRTDKMEVQNQKTAFPNVLFKNRRFSSQEAVKRIKEAHCITVHDSDSDSDKDVNNVSKLMYSPKTITSRKQKMIQSDYFLQTAKHTSNDAILDDTSADASANQNKQKNLEFRVTDHERSPMVAKQSSRSNKNKLLVKFPVLSGKASNRLRPANKSDSREKQRLQLRKTPNKPAERIRHTDNDSISNQSNNTSANTKLNEKVKVYHGSAKRKEITWTIKETDTPKGSHFIVKRCSSFSKDKMLTETQCKSNGLKDKSSRDEMLTERQSKSNRINDKNTPVQEANRMKNKKTPVQETNTGNVIKVIKPQLIRTFNLKDQQRNLSGEKSKQLNAIETSVSLQEDVVIDKTSDPKQDIEANKTNNKNHTALEISIRGNRCKNNMIQFVADKLKSIESKKCSQETLRKQISEKSKPKTSPKTLTKQSLEKSKPSARQQTFTKQKSRPNKRKKKRTKRPSQKVKPNTSQETLRTQQSENPELNRNVTQPETDVIELSSDDSDVGEETIVESCGSSYESGNEHENVNAYEELDKCGVFDDDYYDYEKEEILKKRGKKCSATSSCYIVLTNFKTLNMKAKQINVKRLKNLHCSTTCRERFLKKYLNCTY